MKGILDYKSLIQLLFKPDCSTIYLFISHKETSPHLRVEQNIFLVCDVPRAI